MGELIDLTIPLMSYGLAAPVYHFGGKTGALLAGALLIVGLLIQIKLVREAYDI